MKSFHALLADEGSAVVGVAVVDAAASMMPSLSWSFAFTLSMKMPSLSWSFAFTLSMKMPSLSWIFAFTVSMGRKTEGCHPMADHATAGWKP